ncbi:hypothetical protein ACI8AA_01440 [Geodermatophilus sp. SYSU D01180]
MPFRRRPRRPDDRVGGVDPDRLTRSPFRATEPFTPVDRPDLVRLIRHPQPLTLSSAADWELEVLQWIDELHARGALDDGTYDVADEAIRTRLEAELQLIDDEARAATSTERGLLAPNDQANLRAAQQEVQRLRETDRQVRVLIEVHTARLQGRDPAVDADAQATVGQDRPAAVPPLPAPADLNDVLLPPVRPAASAPPPRQPPPA